MVSGVGDEVDAARVDAARVDAAQVDTVRVDAADLVRVVATAIAVLDTRLRP